MPEMHYLKFMETKVHVFRVEDLGLRSAFVDRYTTETSAGALI